MKSSSWSESRRETPSKKGQGKYALLYGKGYPRVLKGGNPTDRITTSAHAPREVLWRDPAIVLSDADLDECEGAQGLPLKYEHGRDPEVGDATLGTVQYTHLADDDSLNLIARVPIEDHEGRPIDLGVRMMEQVRAGRIRGFSVGYDNDVREGGRVVGKQFNEISLVEEPFFEGCNVMVGVVASDAPGAESTNDSGN